MRDDGQQACQESRAREDVDFGFCELTFVYGMVGRPSKSWGRRHVSLFHGLRDFPAIGGNDDSRYENEEESNDNRTMYI